jgi:copper transport protein
MARFGSRLFAVLAVAGAVLVLGAAPAGAHALRQSSVPDAGASLKDAPAAVTVTFGERPDPKLSSLKVLDSSGQDHARPPTEAVPGQPLTLRVAVGKLANGVYTVSWRTVSSVDGHLASGTFAFGVGATPSAAATAGGATGSSAAPSVASVVARWLLYLGLIVLVGVPVFALRTGVVRRSTHRLLAVGCALGLVGAAGLANEERRTTKLAVGKLLGSSLGHQLLDRVVPLAAVAVVLVVVALMSALRGRKAVMAVVALGGAAAMWGDIESSHAAATRSWRLARMGVQFVHVAAVGVWIGGLIALLFALRAVSGAQRERMARRYSALALACVGIIAASGVQRAFDEVGSLHALFNRWFGRDVLIKAGLLVVLIGLGALNRYRSVPRAGDQPQHLSAVGRIELVIVAGVLAVSAILQGLAPPASSAGPRAVKPTVVNGHDFATSVRVRLAVSPGAAGFNIFTVDTIDYDSGRPVDAAVSLRFALPARPDLGQSTLALSRTKPGEYTAKAANLSIDGKWTVTVLIAKSTGGIEVPLTIATKVPTQKVDVQKSAGLPTIYTVHVGSRAVQIYLDPGKPGLNEFHATVIDGSGAEVATSDLTVAGGRRGQAQQPLTVRRLDQQGHFVADLPNATPGTYDFQVDATAADGGTIRAHLSLAVAG